jgi:hypothetical protein
MVLIFALEMKKMLHSSHIFIAWKWRSSGVQQAPGMQIDMNKTGAEKLYQPLLKL